MHRVSLVAAEPSGEDWAVGGRPIYLDYQATTPVDPRVLDVIVRCSVESFGNASSTDHIFGDAAARVAENARQEVAQLIDAHPARIIFTSGATESANVAIQGFVRERRSAGRGAAVRIGVLPVEHKSVLETCDALAEAGLAEVKYFAVNAAGQLSLEDFEAKCRAGLDLVCIMAANNEIGTLYPIAEAAAIARRWGACFFSDASQAAGRVTIEFVAWGIDLLAFSAHKIYGPKGVGALVVRPGVKLRPLFFGGGQQERLRPGTLDVPGIAGFGEACRLRRLEMATDEAEIGRRRDQLQASLAAAVAELRVNGDVARRLAGSLHVSVPGVLGDAVVARLRERVAISTGSACTSGVPGPSHVLRALGWPNPLIEGALRLGLGKFTTDSDVLRAGELIVNAIGLVRSASR